MMAIDRYFYAAPPMARASAYYDDFYILALLLILPLGGLAPKYHHAFSTSSPRRRLHTSRHATTADYFDAPH